MLTPEQLEQRKSGLGGSDAAAALGLSPWKTPLALYLEKRGEAPPVDETPAMLWGTLHEPNILAQYASQSRRLITAHPPLVRHPQHKWMFASLDARTEDRVVEAKTSRSAEGWGEPGSDEIPEAYLLQVQHYMLVTALPIADVAALIGGSDFRVYTVEADRELHEMLIEGEHEFWQRVQREEPPPAQSFDDVRAKWRRSNATSIEADSLILQAVDDLRAARQQLQQIESLTDSLTAMICDYMGENEALTHNGAMLATWKLTKPGVAFDRDRFKHEHPELWAQYQSPREPHRRYLLK
jgi:putative phage-type endonuclease